MNVFAAAEQLYGAGQRAWEQGHLIAAEPLLQRAIALAPQHASALYNFSAAAETVITSAWISLQNHRLESDASFEH